MTSLSSWSKKGIVNSVGNLIWWMSICRFPRKSDPRLKFGSARTYWIDRAAGISTVINPDEIDRPLETVPPRLPIGPTRQVLLYKSEHFALLRQVIELWGLKSSDFKVVATKQLHPMVTRWASDHGFELTSVELVKVDGSSVQIDTVTEGTPPMLVKHRCALLPCGRNDAQVRSSFELVFLTMLGSMLVGCSQS